MRKFLILSCFLMFVGITIVRAQDVAQFSQYFDVMNYYNPAYVGTSGDLNIRGNFRQQWIGIKRAPRSFLAMADMPLALSGKGEHGVGVVFSSESEGLFRTTFASGQYAYKRKLFGGTLSVGVQLGFINHVFDGTKVKVPEAGEEGTGGADDGIPTISEEGMGLDIGAGFYYTHKNFYAGLGLMRVTEPEIDLGEKARTYIGSAYNFTAGYNIQLRNPLYELQPSLFVMTDFNSTYADITGRVVYNKMFSGGVTWRVDNAVILLLGVTIGRFHAGYSYDYPTNAIGKSSSGSHEVMMSYRLKLKKTQTGKNKHKSVRIL